MVTVRKAVDRGHFNLSWLDTFHTFSFGEYHNESFMGFRSLRVINEDRISAGKGFPPHFHRDMEIITYLVGGSLAHKDNMGNGSTITPGEIQYMSAGRGVEHSEFNPDDKAPSHLLQIWIMPSSRGLPPRYSQQKIDRQTKNRWNMVVSEDGRDGSMAIRQDAQIYNAILEPGQETTYALAPGRGAWLQVISGSLKVNGTAIAGGDGVAIEDEKTISLKSMSTAECLLFDLA